MLHESQPLYNRMCSEPCLSVNTSFNAPKSLVWSIPFGDIFIGDYRCSQVRVLGDGKRGRRGHRAARSGTSGIDGLIVPLALVSEPESLESQSLEDRALGPKPPSYHSKSTCTCMRFVRKMSKIAFRLSHSIESTSRPPFVVFSFCTVLGTRPESPSSR